jgi:hypothetical protein
MHQIVLLTALSATAGLFGGGHHCGSRHCGRPAWGHHRVVQSCAYPVATPYVAAVPQAQPVAPAPQHAAATYHSYYYPAAYYSAGCASGNCARR